MTALERSNELHARVLAFARAPSDAEFAALAGAIAEFQCEHVPGYRRLCEARRARFTHTDALPAVPSEVFRLARVSVFAPESDVARFETSGTTGSATGVHPLRTLATYRALSLMFARKALGDGCTARHVVVALAQVPSVPPRSSLGFMMQALMEDLDGRPVTEDAAGAAWNVRASERWLASSGGLDVAGLRRAAAVALARQEPLIVLATSFALVALLDALGGERLRTPSRTLVMQTGGFKGRTREVPAARLRRDVARAFDVPEAQVISEYGMTELSSQLWEGTAPGAQIAAPPGVLVAPPWLRVTAVDPVSLEPVADGEIGLARFVDLANVDSAVAVLTADRIRCVPGGIELHGRRTGAEIRGCSLALEGLVTGR